jgi:hypothetical protein
MGSNTVIGLGICILIMLYGIFAILGSHLVESRIKRSCENIGVFMLDGKAYTCSLREAE